VAINAKERTIKDLLSGSVQYVVPRYQRPYSWSTKQWKPFWEDLKETARRRRRARDAAAQFGGDVATSPPHQHFFGPIVQVPTGETSRGVDLTRHYLIDGQQRLTTVLILLHSLAEVYAAVDPENRERHAKQIGLYTTNDPDLYPDPQHRTKVLPGRWDRDSFLGVMTGTGRANGNINAGHRFFANCLTTHVKGKEPAAQIEELEGIFDAVRDGLLVACVFIGAGDNSWEIFRSLNDRGLPLSQFDNIRNLFFMKLAPLPEREVDNLYSNHWTAMEDEVTGRHGGALPLAVTEKDATLSLTRFAHAWIQLKQKEQVSTRDLSDRFQTLLDQPLSHGGNAATVAAHAAEQARLLHFYATPFRYLARPQTIGDDETRVRNAIRRGQCLGVQAAADPIMLELLARYARTTPRDIDGFLRCLRVLESWVVRRAVAGVTLKNHNRLLLEALAVPVVLGQAPDTPLDELATAMRAHLVAPGRRNRAEQWPDDEKFRQGFFEDNRLLIGETKGFGGGRGFIRAMLAALEAESEDGVPFERAFTGYQVEHVMPSELTPQWRDYLGPDWDRLHQDRVNAIGNLVLLTQHENAKVGRGLFEEKCAVYRTSELATVRELGAWQTWRKEDIDRRAGRLAEAAIRIWQR